MTLEEYLHSIPPGTSMTLASLQEAGVVSGNLLLELHNFAKRKNPLIIRTQMGRMGQRLTYERSTL